MDYDERCRCFSCGDKTENPCIYLGGFVDGKPHLLAFHFDCYFKFSQMFADRFEETRKAVLAMAERPVG
jgi:hypothetical protein